MYREINRYEEVIETVRDIILNLSYWDCECHDNFIHTIKEKKCTVCRATQEESPNSRAKEVRRDVRRMNSPF
jgi:hypothetical protein